MISWEEAVARIVAEVKPLAPEPVPLADALGRALAEEVVAPRSLPPFANSAMDGWAVRAADAARGEPLPIVGVRYAGEDPGAPLPPGTAARIFTGAPLPPGADCVVRQEDARQEAGRIEFTVRPAPGDLVRPAGEDATAGEVALPAGTAIGPAEIGHAAALGRTHLLVHRRPRVALLATGDELRAVSEPAREGAIFESNTHALAAACVEAGVVPVALGIARDRPGEIEARIAAGGNFDALITCGGASVGERDLVKDALAALGAEERFWRVAVKPGKPFGLYRLAGAPVYLLPGNPASASVTFEIFVRPGLRRLSGHAGHGRHEVTVPLAAGVRKAEDLTVFARGNLLRGAFVASPFQSSGLTRSLVGQRAIAILPAGSAELAAGTPVRCRLLGT